MANQDDRPTLPLDHEPLNREERRRRQFRRGTQPTPSPEEPDPHNPAFGRGGDDQASYTGTPDQDVTRLTGAGTGVAVESDGRVTHHEAMHLPNRPNG